MVLDKWMAEAIIDKLDEFEGEIDEDSAYNLWERENIDGSVTYIGAKKGYMFFKFKGGIMKLPVGIVEKYMEVI